MSGEVRNLNFEGGSGRCNEASSGIDRRKQQCVDFP